MAQINLNPGADATLVAAAYRASMANVPKDLSGTFEAMAENYATTMGIVGEAWGEVAKVGGKLIGEAANNFIEGKKYQALGSLYQNEDGSKFLLEGTDYTDPKSGETTHVNGLNDIKKQIYETWTSGNPFSAENRAKRIKLKQDKNKLYSQIDELAIGYDNIATTLASKAYSEGAMNSNIGDARLLTAIGAMRSSRGTAENGDYVKAGHDKYGDLVLTLFDKDDNLIKVNADDPNSANISIRSADINDIIITKVPEAKDNFYKFTDNMRVFGTQKGTSWNNIETRYMSNIESLVGDSNSLQYMLHEKRLYNKEESCAKDIAGGNGGSITSANIFGMLGNKLPTDAQGNELPVDVMADGNPKLTKEDFMGAKGAANYSKIVSALTNKRNNYYDEDVTREVFLDWAKLQGKDAFDYGTKFRSDDTTTLSKTQQGQITTISSGLKRGKPFTHSLQGGDLSITIDPINKTITQKSRNDEEKIEEIYIDPQKFIDVLLKSPASYDATKLFGKEWFKTLK